MIIHAYRETDMFAFNEFIDNERLCKRFRLYQSIRTIRYGKMST
jgi:hypothetical protein